MIKALLRLLNVAEGEERRVLLLLGYGFFMGVFLSAYKVLATTLFLNQLSVYIREAFFVSGLLGVVSTWLYSLMQDRVKYSFLIIFKIVTVFLFIAAARLLFVYTDSVWLVFALFVMLGPITSLLLLGFWGIFGRMFDLRQSKRLIGGIDSGQLTAIIATTFSIPFLIPFIADLTNILIIGEVGLVISLIIFVSIILQFHLSSFHEKKAEIRNETQFSVIFRNRYIVYLSLFLFLSMAAFVFVDYSFMNVTHQQYPDVKQLASFLGVFEGSIMVLSLFIQTFINERLLSMYGIRTSLLLLPIILMLFTGFALVAGHTFGFDISNPEFIWFFLFISLSKLFVTTLREATENPVFKLFFMPLDSKIRFDIQTKIEGTINEFSRAFSGGLILLLGLLPFFKLIHYSWILVAIIAGWVFLLFKIYHLYRVNIRKKLERQKEAADKVEQKGKNLLVSKLFDSLNPQNPNLMIFALRALSKVAPDIFKEKIEGIKNDHSLDHTDKVLQTLQGDFSFIHAASLKKLKETALQRLEEADENHESMFDDGITELIRSHDRYDRKLAAELISAMQTDDTVGLLIELLNDSDVNVVRSAMNSAAQLKRLELLPFMLDNLQKKNFRDSASEALISYGELAFPSLETIFYNTEQNLEIKIEIINIYGKLGGKKAQQLLWNKIDYPDKNIVSQVLLSLSHSGFSAKLDQIPTIKQHIEEDIESIIWNLKAIEQLKVENKSRYDFISKSLSEENEHSYAHIYMLLSMIYDQKSIQLVKENIETRTNEGISYAIELLDVFLSEDLKQKIIPVLDDISDTDRIKRLQMFYPTLEISFDELIRMLINRSYNSTNRWTKASILNFLGENKIAGKFDLELISNLFNPDRLIQEIAAWSIYNMNQRLYFENIERLDVEKREYLHELIINQQTDSSSVRRPHLRLEIVNFLKDESLLGELPSYILANIVDYMEEVVVEGQSMLEPSEWQNDCFYIIGHGALEIYNDQHELIDYFERGDFIGEHINIDLLEEEISMRVEGDTILFKIEKNRFLDMITNEYEITLKLLDSFNIGRKIAVG